ncbi:LPXTG cell wall anchor domain-containing protein [Glycomyces terrestris]|uniref:LPXTG cell wall anchor domain-containing protein n=1 Tax=Glycomyces terrestris TaxID=2493553 RepID=UPI00165233F0|nr:LPXTG cell wall anchor domain-containing protein [Glycomyces terrestris]
MTATADHGDDVEIDLNPDHVGSQAADAEQGCDEFGGGLGSDQDGWVFVLPSQGDPDAHFNSLSATFEDNDGNEVTLGATILSGSGDNKATIVTDAGWTLLGATASVNTDNPDQVDSFNLTHACAGEPEEPPTTEPPTTEPPTTEPPTTEPPTTEPPTTEPPTTEPPTTEPPTTEPPTTEPPTTEPPTTEPPTTEPPTTEPPTTEPPSTEPPTTEPPSTEPLTTEPPSSESPSAQPPSTESPAAEGTTPDETESDATNLDRTGNDLTPFLLIAGMLLAAGLGALYLARRGRGRTT